MKLTILINCPDQAGIISSVTNFIHTRGGNIVYIDQYVDKESATFFMRLESEFSNTLTLTEFTDEFKTSLAALYQMQWEVHKEITVPKMAIFVSKYDHCLYDLLSRYSSGELDVEIPLIISNHEKAESIATQFKIPFYHIPVTKTTKKEAEEKQLALLAEYKVDFIVLARYMQIVSQTVIDQYPNKIINIHHSFLPAFAGAKPYHAAYKRGVKIIGATSHYVTADLDEGPIIEQDVATVSHTHSINDLIAKGRDLEKIVLARGIKLHIERKTMVFNNKTIVFI
ncbi:formyltetrahydrofolate deformylase [Cellulophaga fucicola]|uniref:Formyltetrahydrofolate deformylase n=1 Tax=Cellulophaga fucicola TaxID=76595 RepID=A0A1K1R0C1_9FLAO|nr:formyltetrahydrofolate deformylase [Cellulophaga fucicola]SFW65623.1 formyltetrahydrofolate deformylase [Cellulophaga fucicola]